MEWKGEQASSVGEKCQGCVEGNSAGWGRNDLGPPSVGTEKRYKQEACVTLCSLSNQFRSLTCWPHVYLRLSELQKTLTQGLVSSAALNCM